MHASQENIVCFIYAPLKCPQALPNFFGQVHRNDFFLRNQYPEPRLIDRSLTKE